VTVGSVAAAVHAVQELHLAVAVAHSGEEEAELGQWVAAVELAAAVWVGVAAAYRVDLSRRSCVV